jgi:hypothetical protein
MSRVVEYTTRFQGVRSSLVGLPSWARGIVLLAALPGLVLVSLSILAFLVSIAALLLLAVPAYRLMRWVTGAERSSEASEGAVVVEQGGSYDSPGRKRVEATIIDPTVIDPRAEAEAVDRAAD